MVAEYSALFDVAFFLLLISSNFCLACSGVSSPFNIGKSDW
nr:MAG TPA: hypothetical protein [Caudoviricetes sp.]